MAENSIWTLPFDSEEAASEENGVFIVGGKGANLARLTRFGFPVPGGFLITTYAYRTYVAENHLEEQILAALPEGELCSPEELEVVSASIRGLFAGGRMPVALSEALLAAYRGLCAEEICPVAVRSSATAEDLPEMSFAGQQDTYLNIVGDEALLKAVVDCWSSLWTARAIGYRMRNHVEQAGAALAVVVQRMVSSEVSGVLFTANPLTGLRSETVIDATLGLGEALVSGKVEPDNYVVDSMGGQMVNKTLGAKAIAIRGQQGGGTVETSGDNKSVQALPDERILDLARLGQEVAGRYGFPQDIEWAWAEGKLYLLQSRPITSLFPTPPGTSPDPLMLFFSFAAVQGILDPVTPMGRDALATIFAAGSRLFGIHVNSQTQSVLKTAGERLWINMTPLIKNSVGRRAMYAAVDIIEPTIKQALVTIWDDPCLQPARKGVRLGAIFKLARFFLPLVGNVLRNVVAPRRRREVIVANGERVLELLRQRCEAVTGDRWARLARQADLLPELADEQLMRAFIPFVSAVATGMAAFNILRVLAGSLPKDLQGSNGGNKAWSDLVLELSRGLPYNPTTEMDLALWAIARAVRRDPAAWEELRDQPAARLAARYLAGEMAEPVRELIARFLDRYGERGFGEIDMGRARWVEDPTHVFEMLASYLQIEDGSQAPDLVFARSADDAEKAADRLVAGLSRTRGGWLKARLARFWVSRMREMLGARESPKFFAVRMMGMVRHELIKTGADFVAAGELEQADDLVFLTFSEQKRFAQKEPRNWKQLIAQRREAYRRESLRRQIPRVLLSDGRAFYEGMRAAAAPGEAAQGAGDGTLVGSPVSPGSAEGRVRVVLDPRSAALQPGEILVCPGTDPSWTPLFMSAAGLVMEVGGMMTHGAVVAREYGIPAIVGVDQATRRLRTGQRVRINGSTGLIDLLDNGDHDE